MKNLTDIKYTRNYYFYSQFRLIKIIIQKFEIMKNPNKM